MSKWLYFLGGVLAGAAGLGAAAYIADACSGKSESGTIDETSSADAPGLDTAAAEADTASGEPTDVFGTLSKLSKHGHSDDTASADMSAAAPEAEATNGEPAAGADIPGAAAATA